MDGDGSTEPGNEWISGLNPDGVANYIFSSGVDDTCGCTFEGHSDYQWYGLGCDNVCSNPTCNECNDVGECTGVGQKPNSFWLSKTVPALYYDTILGILHKEYSLLTAHYHKPYHKLPDGWYALKYNSEFAEGICGLQINFETEIFLSLIKFI